MRNDLHIMVVDTDEAFRSAILTCARTSDRVRFLETLEEAIDLMCLEPVDVVFLDADTYPGAASFSGSKCGHSGIQIIAGSRSASRAISSLEAGATDFIVKSLPEPSVTASIRSCLNRAAACVLHSRLSEFVRRKRDQLDFLTFLRNELTIRDEVTMTFSESYLRECIEDEITVAMTRPVDFSLLLLSFPGYVLYTQRHGADEANKVLRDIADTLLHRLRKTDVVGRYGSNAFCVLLRGTTPADVNLMIPGLRARIEERVTNISNASRSLHVAFRVAGFPGDGMDIEQLFSRLDERRVGPVEVESDDGSQA